MLPTSTHLNQANGHFLSTSGLLCSLIDLAHAAQMATPPSPLDEIIKPEVLRRLLSALHFKNVDALKHSRRVGLLSVGIGSRLGWEDNELRMIEVASLLHDIGKIGIPDHILEKPGKLSPDEAEFISTHHRVAVELLQACQAHPDLVTIIAQSHGVDANSIQFREKETSLGSRILAVADAYESLTAEKPYRKAFEAKEALRILHDQSGKGFDRNVVAALHRWLKSDESKILENDAAGEAAVRANAPATDLAKANSIQLWHLFQYLHLLDSLYDAFYVVDQNKRIIIWSTGATRLFGFPACDLIGQPWHRSIVSASAAKPDPVDLALQERKPNCHSLNLKDVQGANREFNVQSVPITDVHGYAIAVAELVCDKNESKKHRGQFRKLQMAATRDALTGVVNRGELDEQLNQVYQNWKAEPTIPFSVVFLDIDHFKAINDRLSHAVGDRVLVDIARLIQDELYSGEVVGRYGGEEFVILCPETPLEAGIERAERLRRNIMGTKFADRDDLRVTASFGVSQVENGDTPETVVKRADQALYEAKNSGRNRTCFRATRRIKDSPNGDQRDKQNLWLHESEIVTCVASSMLPMKLKGYVEDNLAKIIEVKEDQLILQVGTAGLLGGWGNKSDRQPVKVSILMEELPYDAKAARTRRLILKTKTEPIGRPAQNETFQSRATHVIESLRSYLIAD